MVSDLTTLADVIGATSTAALAFEDTKAATGMAVLKTIPHIVAACFYTKLRHLFVGYSRDGKGAECMAEPSQNGYSFEAGFLLLSHPVVEKGAPVGTLSLKSDLQGMKDRFGPDAWIIVLLLMTAGAGAFVLTEVLQWRISAPVLALASTAKMVSESKDYTVRAIVQARING